MDIDPSTARARFSEANAAMIAGFSFCATLQLRTPLRVLRHHGEFCAGFDAPAIAQQMWEGIWIAQPKSNAELGIDLPDLAIDGSMASEIRYVPRDRGEYLQFLLAVREVVEPQTAPALRRAELQRVLENARWTEIVDRSRGPESVRNRLLPRFVDTIRGLSPQAAAGLVARGLLTPRQIAAAPDSVVLCVRGIGPAKLAAIRAACSEAVFQDDEFDENVLR